jgi:hypothetical protein
VSDVFAELASICDVLEGWSEEEIPLNAAPRRRSAVSCFADFMLASESAMYDSPEAVVEAAVGALVSEDSKQPYALAHMLKEPGDA